MSQHDYIIDNQLAPAFRSDLNAALNAAVTQNSGITAPPTTYANMLWYDTTNDLLKIRNEANSGWITVGTADQTSSTFTAQSVNGKTLGTFTGAGGVAYATSTTALSAIAAGTAGQVLVSNGTSAPSWGTALNVGTAVASTSGSSITFTGIPSGTKRITVILNAVSLSGSDNIQVRIGSGAISTTGYISGTGNAQSGGTTTVTTSTLGYIIGVAAAAKNMFGIMTICNITGNTWVASGVDYAEAAADSMGTFAGTKTLTGTLDRVAIDVSGVNTFDGGTVNVMWE
jgi:hypothetical protein